MLNSSIGPSGTLTAKLIRPPGPGLKWKLKNTLRRTYIWGGFVNWLAKKFSKLTGIPTITAELEARLFRADGTVVDYGIVSYRVVTDNGVDFLGDDWYNDGTDITNMNYHACGTNNTAENATDSALGAEATTITDRATGTKSQPANGQVRSVATQSFTNTGAIVEHGLFSVITESTGVLWDRSVFSAINVGNGDSIQWTYTCTISSGS